MPEYLSPGVYIEEFEIGAKPIEGVATSTAAFLGQTERGPLQPRLVTGFVEYQRLYGGFTVPPADPADPGTPDEDLPLAVKAFFDNGGARVFVARIVKRNVDVDGAATARASAAIGGLRYRAIGPGSWGNRVFLRFSPTKADENRTVEQPTKFRLRIYYWSKFGEGDTAFDPAEPGTPDEQKARAGKGPSHVEDFDDLDLSPASPNFVQKVLDKVSALVAVLPTGEPLGLPSLDKEFLRLQDGDDGAKLDGSDYEGESARDPEHDASWGLTALAEPPFEDVAIVYAPRGFSDDALRGALVGHCERNRYRFLVLDSAPNEADPGTLTPRDKVDSKYAAFYYPWIWTTHPETGKYIRMAPGGAVVGIYARSDIERGVWKAPANEPVRGAIEMEFDVSTGQQDVLNPRGVNVIRSFPGRGIRVWGARTLSSDPLWKYVNVRRLFIFLEASIYRGTQWVVFEPNNEALWARVRQTIAQFLRTQWRAGALMGLKESEAFFVKADRTTMTQNDIDNGRLVVVIGVAPVKPAEFVIFRIAQFTASAEA